MAKTYDMAHVISVREISEDIFSMWLQAPGIAGQARPGQFVSLYCKDRDKLLPRPISLCEMDRQEGSIRLVFRVVGEGTREFASLHAGEWIRILGPLGNGFLLTGEESSRPVLIGGGIGLPPLLQLAKELRGNVTFVAGYRDIDTFLVKDMKAAAENVVIATEDGSVGIRGNVIDAIREKGVEGDVVYACGPMPMLRGVKAWGLEKNIPVWLSLEERMACGLGACLACTCQSTDVDEHSGVKNKRICKDGPVFLSTEVEI